VQQSGGGKGQARAGSGHTMLEFLMSCYARTGTGAAVTARRTLSLRRVFKRVVERLRAAHQRRKQCQELIEYLASDHRAAQDLGIAISEARRLCG